MINYWTVGHQALPPERHQGAAMDLKVRQGKLVWGFGRVPLGVALQMPEGCVVRVTGRSSSFLRGIIVHDGLVESEFNGRELHALVYCPWPRIIRHGQRICQMWALSLNRGAFQRLDTAPNGLAPSKAGFGSTGR